MEEIATYLKAYETLCNAVKKGRRKINIIESIEACTKALNSLFKVYLNIPEEYSYMVYNTLLIGKMFNKEPVDELNTARHNAALINLQQALAKYENISLLNENNAIKR